MDTNPEEFIEKHKWRHLVESEWPMFTEEEQKAYTSKLREILGDVFSEQVLKVLMDEEKDTMRYKASERYAVPGGGGGGGGNGGGSGSVTIKTPTGTHTFTKSGTFTP